MRVTNQTAIDVVISDIPDQNNRVLASTYLDMIETDFVRKSLVHGDLKKLIDGSVVVITTYNAAGAFGGDLSDVKYLYSVQGTSGYSGQVGISGWSGVSGYSGA
jgi:hypothetical protein